MEVNDMVSKAVDQINEEALGQTEQRVKQLVHEILKTEADILKLHEVNVEKKKELKALQLPSTVKVEL